MTERNDEQEPVSIWGGYNRNQLPSPGHAGYRFNPDTGQIEPIEPMEAEEEVIKEVAV